MERVHPNNATLYDYDQTGRATSTRAVDNGLSVATYALDGHAIHCGQY